MPTQKVTTLSSDSIDQFLSLLTAKGKAENTIRAYGTDLKVFLAETSGTGSIPASEFERRAMGWLNAHRRGADRISPKTTSRRLTSLRAFARWAMIDVPHLLEYTAPKAPKSMPHPLPEGIDGVRRMIAAAHFDYHAAYIALCGLCGLRSSEALAVGPGDFDLESMLLLVQGKGDKERRVPVSPEAWDTLLRPVTRAFLDHTPTVVGLRDRFARRVVTDLGRKLQFRRPVSSHDLRATFATAVLDKTGDIRLVQELLGHSSVETTQIYTEVALPKMRQAVIL